MTPTEPCFADVLTTAVRSSGRTLESLRRSLAELGTPVSVATLSYWQSGRSLPTRGRSLDAVVNLEGLLHLPAGTLTDILGAPGPVDWVTGMSATDAVREATCRLGLSIEDYHTVRRRDRIVIGAARQEVSHDVEELNVALRDGVRSYSVLHVSDGTAPCSPVLAGVWGAEPGRAQALPEHRVLAAELLAPRPLRRGEHHWSRHVVRLPGLVGECHRWERTVHQWLRQLVISVHFHPDAVPVAVESFRRPVTAYVSGPDPHGDSEVALGPVPVRDGCAQLVMFDPPSGVVGLRWRWA